MRIYYLKLLFLNLLPSQATTSSLSFSLNKYFLKGCALGHSVGINIVVEAQQLLDRLDFNSYHSQIKQREKLGYHVKKQWKISPKKPCDKVSSHTPEISRQRQTTNNCKMDMNGGKQKEEKWASGSPKSRKVTTSPQFVSVYVTRKICIIDIYQTGLSALLQDCASPLRMSKLQEMVKDQEAQHAAIHGITKSQT